MNSLVTNDRPWLPFSLFLFLYYLILVAFLPAKGHPGDLWFWFNWASLIKQEGLGFIYYTDANYNPFVYYLLYLIQLVHPVTAALREYIYQVKAISLLFDLLGVYLAVQLAPVNWSKKIGLALILLLNPAYLCNTYMWGQVDSILAAFVLLSLVLALKSQPVASMAALGFALATKLQGVIFIPVLGLLLLPYWRLNFNTFFKGAAAFVGVWLLLLLPHLAGAGDIALRRIKIINIYSVDYYPVISANAFNFWSFFSRYVHQFDSDQLIFGWFTLKQWGLLLFMGSSALILLPLAIRTISTLIKANPINNTDWNMVLLSAGLIPLVFCFFNTQMHERYWHPSLILLAAYSFRSHDYSSFLLTCTGYFLNMEAVLQFMERPGYYSFIWWPQVSATLFVLAILIGIIRLYQTEGWRQGVREIKQLTGYRPIDIHQ